MVLYIIPLPSRTRRSVRVVRSNAWPPKAVWKGPTATPPTAKNPSTKSVTADGTAAPM
jgi:hypothetical protein